MDLREQEARKYQNIWAEPWYRNISPGFNVAPEAMKVCGMSAGDTLTDYGCGTGRAAKFFKDHGMWVCGVDICSEALEERLDLFIPACLWDLPSETPLTDWSFSADVLEHIPTEQLPKVISGIMDHTYEGGFLQVAHTPHQDLHLSVFPNEWWTEFLGARLPGFEVASATTYRSTYVWRINGQRRSD
jgi:hypothetical protein